MRATFTHTLSELADRDPRVLLLTADLGFTVFEPFIEKHPDRFFNVGVSEQNMLGLATGLAEAGFIPFVYSIATFASLRPYEFIRNGPILHHLPVRIVGVGGGFEYGTAGPTHHSLEDIGVMRLQPGITVIAPADVPQARSAVLATWDLPGPVYYRLSKDDRIIVSGLDGRFTLGQLQVIRQGQELLMIAMGPVSADVVAAAEVLHEQGIECTVAVVASVNPPPTSDLVALLGGFPVALTVEAHYVTGGVGSLVSEIVAEHGLGCRVVRCGVRESPDGITGSPQYLQQLHGLSPTALVETALRAIQPRRTSNA